jgi:hypothetical protein
MFFSVLTSIEPFTKTLFLLLAVFPYFENKKVSEILASFGINSYICGVILRIVLNHLPLKGDKLLAD